MGDNPLLLLDLRPPLLLINGGRGGWDDGGGGGGGGSESEAIVPFTLIVGGCSAMISIFDTVSK